MKLNFNSLASGILAFATIIVFASSCHKKTRSSNEQPRLQVRLTDNPDPNVKEVWVDIREVRIKMSDDQEIILNGAHPGIYNLYDLTNGRDTILADADIPAGTISQIRLVLGDNNYVITKDGSRIELTTPSAQQSGLKVQVKQDVSGGILYRLILDFDAAKSIVKAGNSGKYILKPVLRIISFLPSGGNVRGVVAPVFERTTIYAINGPDTLASTSTSIINGQYFIRNLPAGPYSFSYVPDNIIYKNAMRNVPVTLGQTTVVDTVRLELK